MNKEKGCKASRCVDTGVHRKKSCLQESVPVGVVEVIAVMFEEIADRFIEAFNLSISSRMIGRDITALRTQVLKEKGIKLINE
jgi:hypothetical protein